MIEVTPQLVSEYYDGRKRHRHYDKTVDCAFHLEFHGDGYYMPPPNLTSKKTTEKRVEFEPAEPINPYFMRLIDMIRPAESPAIKTYRRVTYLPVTKNPVHKVYNVLRKILKSGDWAINWPKSEVDTNKGKKSVSTPVPDAQSLQNYCENLFPIFDSIENWFYQIGMKSMLFDPNGLIVVMPIDWPTKETQAEFLRPFPYTISSKDVYEYKENELIVFKSPNVHEYVDVNGAKKQSMIIIVATQEAFYECYKETNTGKAENYIAIEEVWNHKLDYIPAFKMGGEVMKFNGKDTLYDSFLAPMIPDLDDMARLHSDKQADVIQHVNNIMYYYANQKCKTCDGTGYTNPKGKKTVCTDCQGGYMQFSPFNHFMVTPKKNAIGQEMDNPPMPPVGYLEKSTNITELLIDMVKTSCYNALASVNMEYLGEKPIVKSGVAEAYDQDGGNAFLGRVAYHIVEHILNNVYYFVNEIRNKKLVNDNDKRESLLPTINIPDKFDFITETMLEQKMIDLKKADVAPEIVAGAERDYIAKKYYNDPEKLKRYDLKLQHNPFKDMAMTDVADLESAGVISKKDAIKAIYIDEFVEELIHEQKDLFDMDFEEIEELLDEKAQEKVDELSAQAQADKMSAIPDAYGFDEQGNEIDEKGQAVKRDEFGNRVTAVEDPANPNDVPLRIKNKQTNQKPGKVSNNLKWS